LVQKGWNSKKILCNKHIKNIINQMKIIKFYITHHLIN